MTVYAPGTGETDPKKQNMALQQQGSAISTAQGDIATNTTNIATNTAAITAIQAALPAHIVSSVATAGLATGGPITSTGTVTVTAAVKSDQTTASSTSVAVVPGIQQNHPSAAKAWVKFTGSTSNGNQTIGDSYNVTSVARTSAGHYTVTFTTSFTSANYCCSGSSHSGGVANTWVQFDTLAAGSVDANFINNAGPAAYDPTNGASLIFFGTQ